VLCLIVLSGWANGFFYVTACLGRGERSEVWSVRAMNKVVNHPDHYGGDTIYEAIKVIEAWGLGFHLGNVVKYISRADRKGNAVEDLAKARWYLDREITLRTARSANEEQPGPSSPAEKSGNT